MAKKAARKPKANCQGGLRGKLLKNAPKLKRDTWIEKLHQKSPELAAEVMALISEWVDGGSIRDAYPTRYQLASALAVETGVCASTITRTIKEMESR